MSLFTQAGQAFEETKEKLLGGGDYACRSCEQAVETEYEHCPHCGESTVVELE